MKSLHIDHETHKIYIEYDIKDQAKIPGFTINM